MWFSIRSFISGLTLAKSIRMYDLYYVFANCSTNVDFPIRLAPSINRAVLPLAFCFQCNSLSYAFRLNISSFISEKVYIIRCKSNKKNILASRITTERKIYLGKITTERKIRVFFGICQYSSSRFSRVNQMPLTLR